MGRCVGGVRGVYIKFKVSTLHSGDLMIVLADLNSLGLSLITTT